MNVWYPAHWAPVVMEVLETKNEDFRKKYPRWFPEGGSARASGSYGQSRENRELSFCKGRMDRDESLPTLTGRLKADWIHLPVDGVGPLSHCERRHLHGCFPPEGSCYLVST